MYELDPSTKEKAIALATSLSNDLEGCTLQVNDFSFKFGH